MKRIVIVAPCLGIAAAACAQTFSSDHIPQGDYVQAFQELYQSGWIMNGCDIGNFQSNIAPPPVGGTITFQTLGSAQAMMRPPGLPPVDTFFDVFIELSITGVDQTGPTRTFDTEILQLNLVSNNGGHPITVRESPTRQSFGHETITDIGGGLFQINSFFDVFTELSIDGGPFVPTESLNPTRFNGTPEPSTFGALGAGLLALLARRRRRCSG